MIKKKNTQNIGSDHNSNSELLFYPGGTRLPMAIKPILLPPFFYRSTYPLIMINIFFFETMPIMEKNQNPRRPTTTLPKDTPCKHLIVVPSIKRPRLPPGAEPDGALTRCCPPLPASTLLVLAACTPRRIYYYPLGRSCPGLPVLGYTVYYIIHYYKIKYSLSRNYSCFHY